MSHPLYIDTKINLPKCLEFSFILLTFNTWLRDNEPSLPPHYDMKPPKKLNEYIHFITIIYGGVMDKNGIIECILANSVGYANGLIGRNTFLKSEKHFVNLLKK